MVKIVQGYFSNSSKYFPGDGRIRLAAHFFHHLAGKPAHQSQFAIFITGGSIGILRNHLFTHPADGLVVTDLCQTQLIHQPGGRFAALLDFW